MSIEQKAVRGAMWTISTSVGARALTLVGTLVLTRFLSKDVFGEVSVAQVVVLSANVFTMLGLGIYVVAHPKASRGAIFHATFYFLLLGAIAIGLMVALRGPLGVLLGAPNMGVFVPGLALACVIDRISFMPERLLIRDMRFRVASLQRSLGEVAYSALALWLAATGWGGVSIVIGSLARSVLRLIVCLSVTRWREWIEPHRLNRADSREILRFSLPLSIGQMAYFTASNWDNLIISRLFGPAVTGAYKLAYNLADVPATNVGEQIGDVLLPSFAHMNPEQRKDALGRALVLLSLIVFPLAIGLGAIAPTVVRTIFQPQWESVGPMLSLLSVLSITRPVAWVIGSYLQAQKRTRPIMILEIAKVVGILLLVPTIGSFGPLWACIAVGITYAIHSLASVWLVRRTDGVPMKSLLLPLLPPLAACMVMVAAIVGARRLLGAFDVDHPALALGVELCVGAVAFVAAALVVARDASKDMLGLVRRSRKRDSAAPAA